MIELESELQNLTRGFQGHHYEKGHKRAINSQGS